MRKKRLFPFLSALLLSVFQMSDVFAQGTMFTYQGRLNDGSGPANGSYDLRFTLYDSSSGGTVIGTPLTNSAVTASNGLFTSQLDFGSGVFNGSPRWMEIAVCTNGAGNFTALTPRQALTPTPYSVMAGSASNLLGNVPLESLPVSVVTNGASGVNFSGTFNGNGSGLTNVAGTVPWRTVSGVSQTGSPNQGYLLTNNALTAFTLPVSANPGDIVTVSGTGSNGWQVAAANGQTLEGYNATGAIWTPRATSQDWAWIASSADGTKLVATVINGQIYTSSDSGATWTAQNSGVQNWGGVASSADGTKLAAAVQGGPIYTSSDSGVTWTAQNSSTQNWGLVVSSADGTKLVAATFQGPIYTSSDSGVTWTAQNSGSQPWVGLACSADGTKLVASVQGGPIYTSSDSGVTWIARNSGNRMWQCVASSADGTKLVAAVFGGQIYTSSDSGATWTAQNSGNRNWLSLASSADGIKLVAAEQFGLIYTSSDSGVTWAAQNSGSLHWESVASSADGAKLVAEVNNGQIFTSVQNSFPSGMLARFQYIGNGVWQSLDQASGPTTGTLIATNFIADKMTIDGVSSGDFYSPLALIENDNKAGFTAPALRVVGYGYSGNGVLSVSSQGTGLIAQFGNGGAFVADISGDGTIDATAFRGSGAALTNLNASQISSGMVPLAQLPPGLVTNKESNVTFTGVLTVTNGSVRTDEQPIYLRSGTDVNHGLAYNGNGITNFGTGNAQMDGPALWGYGGGALGVMSGGARPILAWNTSGVGINTNAPANPLDVEGAGTTTGGVGGFGEVVARFKRTGTGSHSAISVDAAPGQDAIVYLSENGSARWDIRHDSSDFEKFNLRWQGGNAGTKLSLTTNGDLAVSGTVTANGVQLTSDRNAKENFASLDAESVLAKVAALPMSEWNYRSDSIEQKHLGPMAQDFHAAFGLNGDDDKHISVVDEGGVALAAIQGLNQKLEAQLKTKDAEIDELKKRLDALEKIVAQRNPNRDAAILRSSGR